MFGFWPIWIREAINLNLHASAAASVAASAASSAASKAAYNGGMVIDIKHGCINRTSWWFQPIIWKLWVKLDHLSPQGSGFKNSKIIWVATT